MMMNPRSLQLWILLALPSSCHAMLVPTEATDAAESRDLASIASPDCWLNAARALELDPERGGMDACHWMTSHHQKVLALELARCHVRDLGRSLFDYQECNDRKETNLTDCLHHLTPSGETAYTHFLTYIHQLCTRLLREVIIGQYYETSVQLAKSSDIAHRRLQEMVQHQEDLMTNWREREHESSALHEQFRNSLRQESFLWTNQTKQLQTQMHSQQEEWLKQHQKMQEGQLHGLEEQQQELQRQREELHRLSETIAKTHQSIKPWSHGLESIMAHGMMGYSLLKGMLFSFGAMFLIWFFTLPSRFQWMRRYMMGLVLLEGFLEIVLVATNDGWLSCAQQNELLVNLRNLLVPLEVTSFLLGALLSCICRRRKHQDDSDDICSTTDLAPESVGFDDHHKELLRRLETYEERWNDLLVVRQQQPQQATHTSCTLPAAPIAPGAMQQWTQAVVSPDHARGPPNRPDDLNSRPGASPMLLSSTFVPHYAATAWNAAAPGPPFWNNHPMKGGPHNAMDMPPADLQQPSAAGKATEFEPLSEPEETIDLTPSSEDEEIFFDQSSSSSNSSNEEKSSSISSRNKRLLESEPEEEPSPKRARTTPAAPERN
jgi:hypothetical protein